MMMTIKEASEAFKGPVSLVGKSGRWIGRTQ